MITPEAHQKAVERFMHDNLPRRVNDNRWPWRGERDAFQRRIENLEARLAATVKHSEAIERLRVELSDATAALQAGRLVNESQIIERLRSQLSDATTALQTERAEAVHIRDALATVRNERDELSRIVNSRNALARRLLSVLVSKGKARAKRLRSPG